MTAPFVDPVLLPPDIAALMIAYLSAAMAPTPVATRLPSPADDADTVAGFLRIEDGGGSKPNMFQYDAQCIIHGYHPNEMAAKAIANRAIALLSAARGQTVGGWYVVGVNDTMLAMALSDPDVILPRYRGLVSWRVAGQPWIPTP